LIPAYGLARLMASAVGDSAPRNPFALVGIPLVLGLSAALASHIPARRATRIDPLAALRDE
jgi:ABC-type antimicrobial peptide transport system permease subunit